MLVQTLLAFAAVAVLGLMLRLFFGRGRDAGAVAWPTTDADDFGLLATAVVVDSAEEAHAFRIILTDAGIRATTAAGRDGRHRVLVFGSELDRARNLFDTA